MVVPGEPTDIDMRALEDWARRPQRPSARPNTLVRKHICRRAVKPATRCFNSENATSLPARHAADEFQRFSYRHARGARD